jgi:phosphate transport system substrate-binding protein
MPIGHRTHTTFILLALALTLTGCGSGSRARPVSIKGSDTMILLGQRWAEVYMRGHPGAVVAVTGGGSGTGIAALIHGTADIAEASRPMAPEERATIEKETGAPVEEHAVAKDGVTVYVHDSNPLPSLTLAQLKGIYTGAITNWKAVGGPDRPITVYSRENSSGTYVFVKEHVLGGADYTPAAQSLPGTAAVVNAVSRDPGGVGYGGIAYGKGIRHVAIVNAAGAPIEPSEATIASGAYPLSRPLYWYLTKRAPQGARDLLAWVLAPAGQAEVRPVGYFPVAGAPADSAR